METERARVCVCVMYSKRVCVCVLEVSSVLVGSVSLAPTEKQYGQ